MKKIEYIAKVGNHIIGTFNSYHQAYNALPEVEINVCFGPNKRKIGAIYHIEKADNLLDTQNLNNQENKEGEQIL